MSEVLKDDLNKPMPTGNGTAMPARTEPSAEDRYAELAKTVESQQKELAEWRKSQRAASQSAPAQRPTVRTLEQQVEELQNRIQEREDLNSIERELQSFPDYAMIKHIPDASRSVLNTLKEERRAAYDRGEGEDKVTVAQAATRYKDTMLSGLKQHLQNPEIVKALGINVPAAAPPANSSRASTPNLTATGSANSTTPSRSLDDVLLQQVRLATRKK